MQEKKAGSGRTTLADVARASGFSVSTVSIVLNEAPLSRYVAEQTKQLIRKQAKQMGYRPDAFARSLRKQRSQTIGIMVFDISDPFCTLILKGIETVLAPTSYLPVIMDAHNEVKQFERYLEMLLERRVEGLIVVANWLFVDIQPLVNLEKERIPTILVGQKMQSGSMSSIMVDNEAGGYLALQHLYELGHREIAVVRGPIHLPDSNKRWAGMKRFAREARLKLAPKLIVDLPDNTDPNAGFDEGYAATQTLLNAKRRFTAIVAFDDMTAFGVVRALRQSGLRVPEDCSVIGFDDVPHAALLSPSLTTIRQPMAEMGRLAAKQLLQRTEAIQNTEMLTPHHHLTTPALIARESTARRHRGR